MASSARLREKTVGKQIHNPEKIYGAKTLVNVERVKLRADVETLLAKKIDYMHNPAFDDPDEIASLLASCEEAMEAQKPAIKMKTPSGLPPYLASLYETSLLTREEERYLFIKMNYALHLASEAQSKLNPNKPNKAQLKEVEDLLTAALLHKNDLIQANLRLVVSIAKRWVKPGEEIFELVSDGNMSLIRAIEKFDFARGNKFSTYATWAIKKNYSHNIPKEIDRRTKFQNVSGFITVIDGHLCDDFFDIQPDKKRNEIDEEARQEQIAKSVDEGLALLDDRERRILIGREGIGGAEERTLEQLGRELGITKERVRQIERRAQARLRALYETGKLKVPDTL